VTEPIADAPTPKRPVVTGTSRPAHGRRSPVSKRHQSNRRKAYGRRQHELYERRQRDDLPESADLGMDDGAGDGMADRFSFMDPRSPRPHFAIGE